MTKVLYRISHWHQLIVVIQYWLSDYRLNSISVNPYHALQDQVVYVYTVSGNDLVEKTKFQVKGEISSMAYSPNGEFLAVASGRNILVHETASYQVSLSHCMPYVFSLSVCLFVYCCGVSPRVVSAPDPNQPQYGSLPVLELETIRAGVWGRD